ncbi:3015_t:CDS:2, partial [Acaulospora morrowiae]
KLANKGGNFQKLSMAIEEGGFKFILLLRLTPFPYPYSNAFFASVQSINFRDFFLATAISLVKLLILVFIGSRFRNLSAEMDQTSRIINYVSVAVGLSLFAFAAWYIYRKMSMAVEQAKRRFLEKYGSEDGNQIFSSEEKLNPSNSSS